MTPNLEIVKLKVALDKLKEKKKSVERNYFLATKNINEIIAKADSKKEKDVAKDKQKKLDEATNFAIQSLDKIIAQIYSVLLEIIKNNQFQVKKSEEVENFVKNFSQQIADTHTQLDSKLNLVKEDNLSIPVVESDKLDEISEESDEVFSPNNFADISDKTSKEILRQIETLDEMNRNDIDFYLSEVEKEIKIDAPEDVKAGLMRDDDYVFNSKFKEMEDRLSRFTEELDTLRAENKTISDTNNTLFELIQQKTILPNSNDKPITSIPTASQYFAALDKSVDSAITKLEKVATGIDPFINSISTEQIKNLENLSIPLIKSLEKTLENLSSDIKILKEENSYYRKQLSANNFLIETLREEKNKKEAELNDSYNSWLSNTRKLADLENILNRQVTEIDELDDSKNMLIENLQNKLYDAKNILDNVILEKENLVEKNEKLLQTIRNLRNIGYGDSVDLDGNIEADSLQDIVEKEANKIIDSKISSLLDKYRGEIEAIKNQSMINLYLNNDSIDDSVLTEAIRDANIDEIATMQNQIDKLKDKYDNMQKSYENLLEKQNVSIDIKEIENTKTQDDSAANYLIAQLMESTKQLRKFEKMLISLDGELNKVEAYKLNNQ